MSIENNLEKITVILGIWLHFGKFLGSILMSAIAHFHWNNFPAQITVHHTEKHYTLIVFVYSCSTCQHCQSHQVARNHHTPPDLTSCGINCKVRSNCWEPFQVLKIFKIKMKRALIIIPRLFCSPDSFCTHLSLLLHAKKQNCTVTSQYIYFSGCIYSSTFRIPPVSNYHVHFLQLHALINFFFPFLSDFVLFKSGTFRSFFSADRWGPQDSRLGYCCSTPLLM